MELIYSTNVLTDAERLSSLLTEAGLLNHVSGVNAACLPGFYASRLPSSISVWLASASQLPHARQIMLSAGFLEQPTAKSAPAWLHSMWFKVAVALIAAILAALAAYGS
jgi:hypothetical protein